MLVLLAAGVYFRRLSLSPVTNVLGLSVLAWGMALSLYNSDLSFSVFFDVAFYLLAAILILQDRPWWVALLMLPAALNRETSLLIPFLLGAHAYFQRGQLRRVAPPSWRQPWASLVYAAVFFGLRMLLRASGLPLRRRLLRRAWHCCLSTCSAPPHGSSS